jgi:hypothetical protein
MASTFSNLGLNLQATGENSGTWGAITNVNLQEIDNAISGVATVTLTGSTTLAFTTNSSSTTFTDEAGRNKTIILSGSLSATTVTVTVPNIEKDYYIINNSGATVTISSGGSTTVSIATGSKNIVVVNASATSVLTALPTDQVNSPGGTTNAVQYNSAGSFAGSTNLTFDNTTLAFQTATGLNLTVTSLAYTTATGTTVTVTNIVATNATVTTANIATANITALAYTTATGTTVTVTNIVATNATVTNAVFSSTVNLLTRSELRLQDAAGGQYIGLRSSTTVATSFTLNLPTADGTNGQAVVTDGSGNLSFGSAGISAGKSIAFAMVFG